LTQEQSLSTRRKIFKQLVAQALLEIQAPCAKRRITDALEEKGMIQRNHLKITQAALAVSAAVGGAYALNQTPSPPPTPNNPPAAGH